MARADLTSERDRLKPSILGRKLPQTLPKRVEMFKFSVGHVPYGVVPPFVPFRAGAYALLLCSGARLLKEMCANCVEP